MRRCRTADAPNFAGSIFADPMSAGSNFAGSIFAGTRPSPPAAFSIPQATASTAIAFLVHSENHERKKLRFLISFRERKPWIRRRVRGSYGKLILLVIETALVHTRASFAQP
jgi:hypothetical protein